MNVPKHIDGMEVVQFATPPPPKEPKGPVALGNARPATPNVAICRAANPAGYCSVFCTEDWTCVRSEFAQTLLEAQRIADRECDADIEWHYPGFGAVRLFPVAQKYAVYSIMAILLFPFVSPEVAVLLAIAAGTTLAVATLAIWLLVGYVAVKSGGWVYGALHVFLVIAMTPVLLVGLFTIPSLVRGDLARWRRWEEDRRGPSGSAD